MTWEDYRQSYCHFRLQVGLIEFLGQSITHQLRDFPKALPPQLLSRLAAFSRFAAHHVGGPEDEAAEVMKAWGSAARQIMRHQDLTYQDALVVGQGPERLSLDRATLAICVALAELKVPASVMRFERFLWSQQVIMVFAHLEGFMAQSLRAVCCAEPERINLCKKHVDLDAIVEAGDLNELAIVIDQCAYDMSRGPLLDRISYFQEKFGVVLDMPPNVDKALDTANEVRNVLVHNDGRISSKFVERSGRADLQVGQWMLLTDEYVQTVLLYASLMGEHLFKAVSGDYYGKKRKELPLIDDDLLRSLNEYVADRRRWATGPNASPEPCGDPG